MIENKWSINKLICCPEYNGLINYVIKIHWSRILYIDKLNVRSIDGLLSFDFNDENFIEFNDLNKNIIFDWLDNSIDYQNIDEQLLNEFQNNLENYKIVSLYDLDNSVDSNS